MPRSKSSHLEKNLKTSEGKQKPYHHGDLRQAIIDTGLVLLAEQGVSGFSLREVARRAKVSPAAPAHHFGSLTGIFSAIAARGFEMLNAQVNEILVAHGDQPTPITLLLSIARNYLSFASDHPALFRLMFDCEKLDWDCEDLVKASRVSIQMLAGVVEGKSKLRKMHWDKDKQPTAPEVVCFWAVFHGFAHLLLERHLEYFAGDPEYTERLAMQCMEAVLHTLSSEPT